MAANETRGDGEGCEGREHSPYDVLLKMKASGIWNIILPRSVYFEGKRNLNLGWSAEIHLEKLLKSRQIGAILTWRQSERVQKFHFVSTQMVSVNGVTHNRRWSSRRLIAFTLESGGELREGCWENKYVIFGSNVTFSL